MSYPRLEPARRTCRQRFVAAVGSAEGTAWRSDKRSTTEIPRTEPEAALERCEDVPWWIGYCDAEDRAASNPLSARSREDGVAIEMLLTKADQVWTTGVRRRITP